MLGKAEQEDMETGFNAHSTMTVIYGGKRREEGERRNVYKCCLFRNEGVGGGGGEVRDKMGKICISVFFAPVSG